MRLIFLWIVILGILGYSWKDWYLGTCGLVLMMAVQQHPDMPRGILGIPGLNPWNLLLANAFFAWLSQRKQEGLKWDLPKHITIMLIVYFALVILGFLRILGDTYMLRLYYREDMTYFVNEYLVNTVKWVIPALMLYDGCRTEERFRLALLSTLAVFVLLSLQVAKWMPPTYALNADALERRSLKVLVNGIGYHRVNLSAMLSGASWAILCTTVIAPRGKRWLVLLTALFVVYAQMMTGGRAGYGAWVAVGIVMCVLRWRRYLLLIPAAGLLATMLLPGVVGRAMQGFTAESHDTNTRLEQQQDKTIGGGSSSSVDSYTVTAGRSLAWPLVIEKIREKPLLGWGRQAMLRSGISMFLYQSLGEVFPHPHNAYLELFLDNGAIGFVLVISFYAVMLFYSIRLFLDRESPTCSAAGGVSTALMLSLLVSSMGSQTFYPREGWVGMWVAMFLALRVRIERRRLASEKAVEAAPVAAPEPRRFARVGAAARARTDVAAGSPAAIGRPRPAAAGARRGLPLTVRRGAAATATPAAPTRRRFSPRPGSTAQTAPVVKFRSPAQPEAAATPATAQGVRPRRSGSHRRPVGIAHSGFFGSTLRDSLVWEQP